MGRTPASVKRAADEAAKLQQEIYGKEGEEPKEPEIEEPPKPEPKPSKEEPGENWKDRFTGMQRLYQEKVPELEKKLEERDNQIQALTKKVEAMEEAQQERSSKEPAYTPEEVEEYGEDLIKLIERITAANKGSDNQEMVKQLNQRLDELGKEVKTYSQTQQRTAQERFFDDLKELVPDWETINNNKRFHAWLAEEMPLTGRERQDFLSEANQRLDAKAVANFFTQFKKEAGVSSGVEPGTAGDGGPPPREAPDGRVYTRDQIAEFYELRRRGKLKMSPEEMAAVEADMHRAVQEGRIR